MTHIKTKFIWKNEENILKRMLGLTKRCRTANVILALNVESTAKFIENQKTEFIIKLSENPYTRQILEEIIKNGELKDLRSCTEHIFNDDLKEISEVVAT